MPSCFDFSSAALATCMLYTCLDADTFIIVEGLPWMNLLLCLPDDALGRICVAGPASLASYPFQITFEWLPFNVCRGFDRGGSLESLLEDYFPEEPLPR